MQRLRVDLKTFLSLAMSNQYFHSVRKLILSRFLGGIFGQETPNLIDPYIILPYYITLLALYLCINCNITLPSFAHKFIIVKMNTKKKQLFNRK